LAAFLSGIGFLATLAGLLLESFLHSSVKAKQPTKTTKETFLTQIKYTTEIAKSKDCSPEFQILSSIFYSELSCQKFSRFGQGVLEPVICAQYKSCSKFHALFNGTTFDQNGAHFLNMKIVTVEFIVKPPSL